MTGSVAESTFETRLASVRQRVQRAAEIVGRDPDGITIVGVTKSVGRPEVDDAYRLGLRFFGENRVQDAKAKFGAPLPVDASLHLIGSLQSNKAKIAVELFDVIESVDRRSLVEALSRQVEGCGGKIIILLEIN